MAKDVQLLVVIVACFIVLISSSYTKNVQAWNINEVKGWKGEDLKFVYVGGKVLCQDCTKDWNHWTQGVTPLNGSKIAVTCMDARKRVVYHAIDKTDKRGEFEVPIRKYINGKEIKPEGCSVRLVSSPDESCNIMTDFGRGQSGIKLRRPSHVYPGMVKYTVGPFYFTSPLCDEPETSPGSGNGSGY